MKRAEGDAESCGICPFCRTSGYASDEELVERVKKRANTDDSVAVCILGGFYDEGEYGFPQDHQKALELYLRAHELGYVTSNFYISGAYLLGRGVERNLKKAKDYLNVAAMKGHCRSRYTLGRIENDFFRNGTRAVKHWIIAAEAGYDLALKDLRECLLLGMVSKEDYEKAVRAHQKSNVELKSEARAAYYEASNGD